MATKRTYIRHMFGGGWATDFGPATDAAPDASWKVLIPFLLDAENVFYELDGGPHKIGGTDRVNSTQITSGGSGSVITGIYDYWRQGTGGSPTRRRVLHADTRILADANDSVFSNELFTGLTDGAVPSYATFDDLLIIASDSTTDVPKSWDQTTAQSLAGTPPRFSFSTAHHNRLWAAGNYSAPSRLYYSVLTNPEDWTGSGSGSIDIDPDDGDMITGIASHKNDLFVFKGPYKGSIHRITGTSPTGSDAFARSTFIRGLGAAWHNGIFPFKDDLGFVSQYGTVHSLAATAAFGDFNEAALSRPIHKWIKEHLNFNRLRNITAVNDVLNGRVLFAVSADANSTNNKILMMDYRDYPNGPIKWALWPLTSSVMGSLGVFTDTDNTKKVFAGGNDGYLRKLDVVARSVDGSSAISAKVTTPYLNYGQPILMKTLSVASVGIAPKGNYSLTLGWSRDGSAQQTESITQGGGDVLGTASSNQFTLGTSTLAGGQFVDRYVELQEGGEFRAIQYQITQSGNNDDLEVHSISSAIAGGAWSTEN